MSDPKKAVVNVIDGKIEGYVRASDLRAPVRDVKIFLDSPHVDKDVLREIAKSQGITISKGEGKEAGFCWTLTNNEGYYVFGHLPLGTYKIQVSKKEGDEIHEFEVRKKTTELTLAAPNQLAIDFVDNTVAPVGGRIIYSLQKNGQDVLVEDVSVTAQCPGVAGYVYAEHSKKSLSATGVNYSMPLLAGQYLFIAQKGGHDIRIKTNTPDYDSDTQLVSIKNDRTDVDFIDYTTRKLTVFVVDSGKYKTW